MAIQSRFSLRILRNFHLLVVIQKTLYWTSPWLVKYVLKTTHTHEIEISRVAYKFESCWKDFTNVMDLSLSIYICKAIRKSKQELPLPRYDILQRPEMSVADDAELLLELLHCAPSLKFLDISQYRDLARFFLKNGVSLKKVCLANYFPRKVRLVEQISKFPRVSARVKIVTR